ncbi:hypothetical protein AbraIFM66950_005740 [Aspergillus brasiliensis]|nr:hypothetical protein AbraIFM66950_005740 [Aspergillus brasiliensis]
MKFWSILGAGFICAVQAAVSSNGTTGAKLAQIKNLLKPQLSDDAFIARDLAKSNHSPDVTVYYPMGVQMNLSQHLQDIAAGVLDILGWCTT